MKDTATFESIRSNLHHNRLKNEFLYTMGYYPAEEGHPRRGDLMLAAVAGDADQWVRLHRGCTLWASLGEDIRLFLATLPTQYGYVLSERFNEDYCRVTVALTTLDEVVGRIACRALQSEEIGGFWQAADAVRTFLERLAKSRDFGTYVIDIDVRLLQENIHA